VKETLIKLFIPQKEILLLTVFLFTFSLLSKGQCRKDFEFAFGGTGSDIAYDIIDAGNNQFYVIGTTNSFGSGGNDILIVKSDLSGNIIWSKVFGGTNDEFIRKAKKTSDGGLLVTGQTRSFTNRDGDILCFKVNINGGLVWSRKFGVNSPHGDLGMDIIETSDGGYAISGILNVIGNFADAVVIKLDNNANVTWAKRFNTNDGEDGVGVLEANGNLIATADLQHFLAGTEYGIAITQLNINNGQVLNAKTLAPNARGLFNPYIFKDVNNNGFWISGHMIDGDSYAQMQQTILRLDNNFNIIRTYKLEINPLTNDFLTGFIPLPNGFVTCASPQTNASGYIYQVNADGSIKFARHITGSADKSFYRVEHVGNELIAVGKDNWNGNNDGFISLFDDNSSSNAACNADTALLNISSPAFTQSDFLWPSITDQLFSNTNIALPTSDVSLTKTDICFIENKPTVFLGNDTSFCSNNSVLLNAKNPNASYVWEDGSTNQTHTVNSTGIYSVTVTNSGGCSSSDSIVITVLPLPVVTTINDTSLCSGSSITLATSSNIGKTFLWSSSMGISNVNSISPVVSPATKTKYVITATSAQGCSSKDSVTINVLPSPTVSASVAEPLSCVGTGAHLSAISSGAIQYNWSPSNSLNNSSVSDPIASPNISTNYVVQVKDGNGCMAKDSVVVNIKQKSTFNLTPSSAAICTGESIILTASGGDIYQWLPSQTIQNPNSSSTSIFPSTNTTYKVIITDSICHVTDSLFSTITLTSLPNTAISKSNDVDCVIGEAKLIASGGTKYVWSPASSLSNSNIANPVATPAQTTTYHVQISNGNGCSVEDSIEVKVFVGEAENGYLLPSAFSPNKDGVNDCFGVKKWGYVTDLDFRIYNRWGNLVFHTMNSTDCWDGTFKGIQQPADAYVYQIRAKTICGNVFRKGTIILIR